MDETKYAEAPRMRGLSAEGPENRATARPSFASAALRVRAGHSITRLSA